MCDSKGTALGIHLAITGQDDRGSPVKWKVRKCSVEETQVYSGLEKHRYGVAWNEMMKRISVGESAVERIIEHNATLTEGCNVSIPTEIYLCVIYLGPL